MGTVIWYLLRAKPFSKKQKSMVGRSWVSVRGLTFDPHDRPFSTLSTNPEALQTSFAGPHFIALVSGQIHRAILAGRYSEPGPIMSVEAIKQAIKKEIEKLSHVQHRLEGGAKSKVKGGPRTMSASARKRISLAQKKRWAKVRAAKK